MPEGEPTSLSQDLRGSQDYDYGVEGILHRVAAIDIGSNSTHLRLSLNLIKSHNCLSELKVVQKVQDFADKFDAYVSRDEFTRIITQLNKTMESTHSLSNHQC